MVEEKSTTTDAVMVDGKVYGDAVEIARFIDIKGDIIRQAIRTGEIPSRVLATSRPYVKYEDALTWADGRSSGALKSKWKAALEFMIGGGGWYYKKRSFSVYAVAVGGDINRLKLVNACLKSHL